jgi:hypothetical protein
MQEASLGVRRCAIAETQPQTDSVRGIIASWLAQARKSGEGDIYSGKRQDVRYTWSVCLEMTARSSTGLESRFLATARDVSEEGMGIFCWRRLEPGTVAWVRLPSKDEQSSWVPAKVKHSTATTGGYYTGVMFSFELNQ